MGMNRRSLLGAAGLALGAPALNAAQAAETPAPAAKARSQGPAASARDEDPRGVHPRLHL